MPIEVRAIPGLAITGDGVPVGEPQWGTPLPVDKGAHSLVATAPGRRPWTETFTVAEDGASVTIVMKPPPAPGTLSLAPEAKPAVPFALQDTVENEPRPELPPELEAAARASAMDTSGRAPGVGRGLLALLLVAALTVALIVLLLR